MKHIDTEEGCTCVSVDRTLPNCCKWTEEKLLLIFSLYDKKAVTVCEVNSVDSL